MEKFDIRIAIKEHIWGMPEEQQIHELMNIAIDALHELQFYKHRHLIDVEPYIEIMVGKDASWGERNEYLQMLNTVCHVANIQTELGMTGAVGQVAGLRIEY